MTNNKQPEELDSELRLRLTAELKKAFKLKVIENNDGSLSEVARRLIEEYVSAE